MFETGKHGYRELAYLLGVPDSDAPYLRTNSSSEFGFIIGLFRTIAALTIAVPGGLVWCALRLGRRRRDKPGTSGIIGARERKPKGAREIGRVETIAK